MRCQSCSVAECSRFFRADAGLLALCERCFQSMSQQDGHALGPFEEIDRESYDVASVLSS